VKTISAAMVLYDEELMVDLSIKSAKDIVDEFVFVDNGCSDRTMEIGGECINAWGLKARTFKFEGTLKDARTFSCEKCETDWIFIHDGDHVLQTEGPYAMRKVRKLVGSEKIMTYKFPLIRLFYDYEHTSAKLPFQPPHKTLYCNNPQVWAPAAGTRNLPTSLARENALRTWWGVWNICIKRPERIYERQFWPQWRHAGRVKPRREWIAEHRGFELRDFNQVAEKWLLRKVFETDDCPNPEVWRFWDYPAVIREEIDRGVIRNCLDTVDSIREKRVKAGLEPI